MENRMKTNIIMLLVALATTAVKADCNYTKGPADLGCYPAGSVVTQSVVTCTWSGGTATLYNQITTEVGAWSTDVAAVNVAHPSGHDSWKTNVTFNKGIPCTVTTVDPATCNLTITPHGAKVDKDCPGKVEDGNPCSAMFASRDIELKSYYSLAFIY
jgi:hypothetical protein